MDSSTGGERSDQEKQKKGQSCKHPEDLSFWQNGQKLAIKIKRWKKNHRP